MDLKLCCNCKYYGVLDPIDGPTFYTKSTIPCLREPREKVIDLVDGRIYQISKYLCVSEREENWKTYDRHGNELTNKCGSEGKYFVPKE